jgi:hypothetical protein
MIKENEDIQAKILTMPQEVVIVPNSIADVSLEKRKMADAGRGMLIVCFLGIFGCYFVYGLLQETM